MGKVHETTTQTLDLDLRNEQLEHELQDVDRMAHRIELDKQEVIRTADQEILDAKVWTGGRIWWKL